MKNFNLLNVSEPDQGNRLGKAILVLVGIEGLVTTGLVGVACASGDFVGAAEWLLGGTATMTGTGLALPYFQEHSSGNI